MWNSFRMDDLLQTVEEALRRSGWSARRMSLEAVGSEEYIRSLRRGRMQTIEKFRTLCERLGLEFYVGPPRGVGQVDERRLEEALVASRQLYEEARVELADAAHARVVAAVYDLLGEGRSPATAARLRRLVAGLADSESRSGEPSASG